MTQPALLFRGLAVPDVPLPAGASRAALRDGSFQRRKLDAVSALVRRGDRVLDLGAGLGLCAALALSKGASAAVALDAEPCAVAAARALFAANGMSARARALTGMAGSRCTAARDRQAGAARQIPLARLVTAFKPTLLVAELAQLDPETLCSVDLAGVRGLVLRAPDRTAARSLLPALDRLDTSGLRPLADHATAMLRVLARGTQRGTADARAGAPPRPDGGWSHEILTLDGATIVPGPANPPLSFPAGLLKADGSPVPHGDTWRRHRRITLPPPAPGACGTLDGTWLWGGLAYGHFGHFLCESLGRLWALDRITPPPDGIALITKFTAGHRDLPGFIRDAFRLAAPTLPLRVIDSPTRVERLIVPGQAFGLDAMAGGTPAFRRFMQSRFARDIPPDGPDRLYISRAGLPSRKGGLLFEDRLERLLAEAGYAVFHPEAHDLPTQIARYKAARFVLAAEGSALHLFGFVAQAHQRVGVILRRRSGATQAILRQISAFAGRAPEVFEHIARFWMPAAGGRPHVGVAELDLPALGAALAGSGFIDPAHWPATTLKEARARIAADPFRARHAYRPV